MFRKLFNYHAYNVPLIGIHKLAFPVDRNVGRNSSRIFTSFIDRANSQFVTNLRKQNILTLSIISLLKPETCNLHPETWNLKPETKNLMEEIFNRNRKWQSVPFQSIPSRSELWKSEDSKVAPCSEIQEQSTNWQVYFRKMKLRCLWYLTPTKAEFRMSRMRGNKFPGEAIDYRKSRKQNDRNKLRISRA